MIDIEDSRAFVLPVDAFFTPQGDQLDSRMIALFSGVNKSGHAIVLLYEGSSIDACADVQQEIGEVEILAIPDISAVQTDEFGSLVFDKTAHTPRAQTLFIDYEQNYIELMRSKKFNTHLLTGNDPYRQLNDYVQHVLRA